MALRTAQNIHTVTLLQIDDNTYISTNKSSHFTSLKFTSLHFSATHYILLSIFTFLHFWKFCHNPSKPLHFSTHKTICDLQG